MTISQRIDKAKEQKLNNSSISKAERPTTPFGEDNPFNLSRMGYANPAAIDRQQPSALKSRPKIPRTPAGAAL